MNYQEALNQGKVVIRAMWWNSNAKMLPVTMQLAARVPRSGIPEEFFTSDSAASSDPFLAIVGASSSDAWNFTVLRSWKLENLKERFDMDAAFEARLRASSPKNQIVFEGEGLVIDAADVFGMPVAINVERCTVKNPLSLSQEPVTNPSTGAVTTFEGKDVYQHTRLIVGSQHQFIWSGHDVKNPDIVKALTGTGNAPAKAVKNVVESLVNVQELVK